MAKVEVRQSVPADIEFLKDKLRESDVRELWAASHEGPELALKAGLRHSVYCRSVVVDGEPVAMFGVSKDKIREGHGCAWLLASDKLAGIKTRFLRLSRKFIGEMLELYPVLFNLVDQRNTTSIEWLKWCGAKMGPIFTGGAEGLPFIYFEIRRDDNV